MSIIPAFILLVQGRYAVLNRHLLRILKRRKRGRLARLGVEANAVILHVDLAGLRRKGAVLRLLVQVQPARDRNFVTEILQVYSLAQMEDLGIGKTIRVKYNPSNIKEAQIIEAVTVG